MNRFTMIDTKTFFGCRLCLDTRLCSMYVQLNGAGQLRPRCDLAVALRVAVEGSHSPALHSIHTALATNVVLAYCT